MLGMSNSLRQRLGAGPEPQLHPDSDLLTAYIERSLAPAEQADMVRHLAACSWCREVVALSLPEVQVLPAAVPARGRWAWFWFPTLRWSAVAATVLIGAALLIEKPWKSRTEPAPVTDMVAQKAAAPTPPPVTASAPAAESANAIPASHADIAAVPSQSSGLQASAGQPSPAAIGGLAKKTTDMASLRRDEASGAGRSMSRSALAYDARNSKQLDAASVTNGFAGAVAPVTTVAGELVSAPAPKAEVTGQNARFLARSIPITPDSIRNSALAVTFGDEKSKSDTTAAYSAGAQGGSRVFSFPRKIITASKDKIAGTSPSRTSGMAWMEKEGAAKAEAAPPAERLHWSISPDGKLIKSADLSVWHEVYPQKDDLLFRVVVAEGHDVWAGGSHLTLIHSWNGGVDWKKMKLGEAATGDITDIVIGNGDVQVKTSNDQTWVSQDGGITWVPLKQPAPAQPK
jgi:hypothetical protein